MFSIEVPIGGELEVRFTAQCDYCDNTHTEIKEIEAGADIPTSWDIPAGWSIVNNKYVCDRHKIEVKDKSTDCHCKNCIRCNSICERKIAAHALSNHKAVAGNSAKIMFVNPHIGNTEVLIKDEEKHVLYKTVLKHSMMNTAYACVDLFLKYQIDRIEFDVTGCGETFGDMLISTARATCNSRDFIRLKNNIFGYRYANIAELGTEVDD